MKKKINLNHFFKFKLELNPLALKKKEEFKNTLTENKLLNQLKRKNILLYLVVIVS
jgi:hypothetical protein